MTMSIVSIPNVFFLSAPQDGVSVPLLSSLGARIARHNSGDQASLGDYKLDSEATDALKYGSELIRSEFSLPFEVAYKPRDGAAVVDIRDTTDEWIRIILHSQDILFLSKSVGHRIGSAQDVIKPFELPDFAQNADVSSSASTVLIQPNVTIPANAGTLEVFSLQGSNESFMKRISLRFSADSKEALVRTADNYVKPGTPDTRELVVNLCESFYHLGWVTGTGGSISIRHGSRIFMAPSGVQKERMQPQDIFVLDSRGDIIYQPQPLLGKPRLKLSQCAPLFHQAFTLRNSGACIHTHDKYAVLVTLLAGNETEFRITHQEMIKGIQGHGFLDTCVVPIIENTPHECDLADSLSEAIRKYPRSNAVLVRRHGVYVWGDSWEQAKVQAECYHYLFEMAVRMREINIDPSLVPVRVTDGIGAATSYGSGNENRGGQQVTSHVDCKDTCCGASSLPQNQTEGFHGTKGLSAEGYATSATKEFHAIPSPLPVPTADSYQKVVLDIEGCTTSIQFVHDVLFPYFLANVESWLHAKWDTVGRGHVQAMYRFYLKDVENKVADLPVLDDFSNDIQGALVYLRYLVAKDRKIGPFKDLQGDVWTDGYEKGDLKGHVFADTPVALASWIKSGKDVYIFSSGSRHAQRLLFQYSDAGDLRTYLKGYFDTKTAGPKVDPCSYAEIALSLGVSPTEKKSILFLTDAPYEAIAAKEDGWSVALTHRPGNNIPDPKYTTQGSEFAFPVISTLTEVL